MFRPRKHGDSNKSNSDTNFSHLKQESRSATRSDTKGIIPEVSFHLPRTSGSATPTQSTSEAIPSSSLESKSSTFIPTTSSRTTVASSEASSEVSAHEGHKPRVLRDLSDFLVTTGLPPLPPNVVRSKLPEALQVSLDHSIAHVMHEFHRRGDLIQELVKRLSKEEQAEQAVQMEKAKQTNHKTELETRLDQITGRVEQSGRVKDANQNARDLLIKYEQVKQRAAQGEAEASLLRQELTQVMSKMDQEQRRKQKNLETLRSQHRRPGHGALDQVTADVIDVYEQKIDAMQSEVHNLRRTVSKMTKTDDRDLPSEVPLMEPEMAPDHFLRLKHTLEQQIGLLHKKLEEQQKKMNRVEEERDVLKLQLVNLEKVKATTGNAIELTGSRRQQSPSRLPKGVGTTRDMIRRDKLNYKLKLFQIDELPAEDCRDLLKDICIRLNVSDVLTVVDALDEVAKVVHMVPKMQKFIRQVDALVWNRSALSASGTNSKKPSMDVHVLHKVKETYSVIQFWSEELRVLDHVRTFMKKLFTVLGLDLERQGPEHIVGDPEVEEMELLCLEEIKRLMAFEKNTYRVDHRNAKETTDSTYPRIVSHFCNLFEIQTVSEVFPKMNELFVFSNEVKVAIQRLRDILGLPDDGSLKIATVVNRAADELMIKYHGFTADRHQEERHMLSFDSGKPDLNAHEDWKDGRSFTSLDQFKEEMQNEISLHVSQDPSQQPLWMQDDPSESRKDRDVVKDLENLIDRMSWEEEPEERFFMDRNGTPK
jgi:hypothetical protein